ncbi:hypothetical protein LSTR_LSTR009901 [Laodelphax striatellus]|uniref:Uncharacterized protein n=1 Tax=Laodelphax striatellus TaxID=195883 RepID=A0A482WK22_LAOST|nr:hypothetical protein LSTR_LSTR009901 [Laodelphax striatellus]
MNTNIEKENSLSMLDSLNVMDNNELLQNLDMPANKSGSTKKTKKAIKSGRVSKKVIKKDKKDQKKEETQSKLLISKNNVPKNNPNVEQHSVTNLESRKKLKTVNDVRKTGRRKRTGDVDGGSCLQVSGSSSEDEDEELRRSRQVINDERGENTKPLRKKGRPEKTPTIPKLGAIKKAAEKIISEIRKQNFMDQIS